MEKELEIDRIGNNLSYTPQNCRWVTKIKNIMNRRNTVYINVNGKETLLAEYYTKNSKNGVSYKIAATRIKRGWHPLEAVCQNTE